MKPKQVLRILSALPLLGLISCATSSNENEVPTPQSQSQSARVGIDLGQVPTWSRQDLDFFLHGSMSTEVVPEAVLRAFIRTYPDLFATSDLSHFGMIPDPGFGWPVGFSRGKVPHLGGLSAVGLNCAACHVGEVTPAPGAAPVRVLGMTSHFDAEAFFGSVIVATFRTADAANMKKFLSAYLAVNDPLEGERMQGYFAAEWQRQEEEIAAAIAADPSGSRNLAPGALHPIRGDELRLDHRRLASIDLAALAHAELKLFHNMRAALHVPDQPPDKAPPASGPGRNDAFGLLSAALFGAPQPYSPVKYGLVWNVENRYWVHWDGNTRSPLGRNLLASLGLGAPLLGKHGELDFARVKRQTDISERIQAPRYPFAIDDAAAKRGAPLYQARCAACHAGPEGDGRLYATTEVGTEPHRAEAFTQLQADRFNKFLTELEIPGYRPGLEPRIRSTQKYWAATLTGVWARSPYLHNGSVRTMQELLTAPAGRAKTFHRGSRVYDAGSMGYADAGAYVLETTSAGNSNAGHNYGTDLSSDQKRELIEYLKTL
jgi:mono/diheme cytochrome c family protein